MSQLDPERASVVGHEGFVSFYRTSYAPVAASVAAFCSDIEVARDATDEAFSRALARWDRVGQMESPRGWTVRVAMNCCKRAASSRERQWEAEKRSWTSDSLEGSTTSVDSFFAMISTLPYRQRQAVALRYIADLTQRDIATAMGIQRSTVGVLLSRAHRALSQALSYEDQEGQQR